MSEPLSYEVTWRNLKCVLLVRGIKQMISYHAIPTVLQKREKKSMEGAKKDEWLPWLGLE